MKLTYNKPEFTVEELMKADVLLSSIMDAEKNGTDNTDFGVQDLFRSISEDIFGGGG